MIRVIPGHSCSFDFQILALPQEKLRRMNHEFLRTPPAGIYSCDLRRSEMDVHLGVTGKEYMRALILTHKVLWIVLFVCLLILFFPLGCGPTEQSGIGFRLPKGDVDAGKLAFVELDCIRCHSIYGEENAQAPEKSREIHVVLGGESTRVKTYGQLVTSVIYPDHIILPKYRSDYVDRDGNSEMPDFTEEMTVKQLIDVVTYLQSTYKVKAPPSAYDMVYPEF